MITKPNKALHLPGKKAMEKRQASLGVMSMIMNEIKPKLTLSRPATYQIKVPGHLDERWADWVGGMTITFESEGNRSPITILTGTFDQATLLSLLRRLYSLGLPLISVICVEIK
jgi:hypothetical protein